MPSYNVVRKGFRHGRLYDPNGKRKVIVEELPFTDQDGENPKPRFVGDEIEMDNEVEESLPEETQFPTMAEEEALKTQFLKMDEEEAQRKNETSDITNSEEAQASKPADSVTEVLG